MKKILCFILCFIIMTISAFAATFTDVGVSDYYASAASFLSENGILTGYPDGSFGPEKTITRAEITAVIVRMLGRELDAKTLGGTASKFIDVEATKWYSGYVNLAANEGIVNGVGDAVFAPENPVTFEQAITMVVRAIGLESQVKMDSNDWSKGYLDLAWEKGILNSLTGSKGTNATRGDVAVMVYNGINMSATQYPTVQDPTEVYEETPSATEFSDNWTVTFIEDIETEIAYLVVEVPHDGLVDIPAEPMLEGYEFTGWYEDENFLNQFNFLTPITEDTTIYAGWSEEEEEEEDIYFDEEGNPIDPEEWEELEDYYGEEDGE